MSWKVRDVYCTQCDEFEENLYDDRDGPGPCPACGAARQLGWAIGSKAPSARVFKPIDLGYKTVNTQAELKAEVAAIHNRFPGTREVVIEGRNHERSKVVAEEHKHRAIERRKSNSISENMVDEYRAERTRVRREAATTALKQNENPKPAADKAVQSMKPLGAGMKGA